MVFDPAISPLKDLPVKGFERGDHDLLPYLSLCEVSQFEGTSWKASSGGQDPRWVTIPRGNARAQKGGKGKVGTRERDGDDAARGQHCEGRGRGEMDDAETRERGDDTI